LSDVVVGEIQGCEHPTKLENIGSRIDMQTRTNSSSAHGHSSRCYLSLATVRPWWFC